MYSEQLQMEMAYGDWTDNMLTDYQIYDEFEDTILPSCIERHGDDPAAQREAFRNFTYTLYENGQMSEEQYDLLIWNKQ
jgi:hypothetical protein